MPSPPLISGGFYITRPFRRPQVISSVQLLPEVLVSLSSCFADILPDAWAISWASCSDVERVSAMSKLGIPLERLPSLLHFMTGAMDHGELGWPCTWRSLAAARRAKAEFMHDIPDSVIVELGIPEDLTDELTSAIAPNPSEGETGIYSQLVAHTRITECGHPLGWEVLGAEIGGTYHSWLCNALHEGAAKQLALTPDAFGLLPTEQQARRLLDLIDQGIGAEPVPWFPGFLQRLDDHGPPIAANDT